MDFLAENFLDVYAPSLFWKPHPDRIEKITDRMDHCLDLGEQHDKLVYGWINGWWGQWNADGTEKTFRPVPPDGVRVMIGLAEQADVLVYWDHAAGIFEGMGGNSNKVIAAEYTIEHIYAQQAMILGAAGLTTVEEVVADE